MDLFFFFGQAIICSCQEKKPNPASDSEAYPIQSIIENIFFFKINQLTLTRKGMCVSFHSPTTFLNRFLHTFSSALRQTSPKKKKKKPLATSPNSNSVFFTKPPRRCLREEKKRPFLVLTEFKCRPACLGDVGQITKTLESPQGGSLKGIQKASFPRA